MKAVDFYRKVAPDLLVGTKRGGVLSVFTLACMGYMFLVETYVFLGAGPVRERIDLELGLAPMRINIDVEFPQLQCGDAKVELWRGKTKAPVRGMDQTLRVHRWNPQTKHRKPYREGAEATAALPGCKLQGFLSYEHTSPGTFAVTAPRGANLSHTVHDFTFGMPVARDTRRALARLPERFARVADPKLQSVDYFHEHNDKVFMHYVHVVPTKYHLSGRKAATAFQVLHQSHLSHVDTHLSHVDTDGLSGTAATRFSFDISPMVAEVTNRSSRRWYDYITSLLAILGGFFTVVQLVDRGLGALF
mmetsp:Transcript_16549/g.49415  ORF Transcript_16549/g.49415 Transcript_16549/m.49415 type:complete len:304 (-) Transcript_16549:31-942(-)